MEKITWEKKEGKIGTKSMKEREEIIKDVKQGEKNPSIEREVTIGFNANQFFIRFPREFSEYLQLNSKKAGEKKYRFKIILDTSQHNRKDKIFKGNFEVTKNE